MGIGGLLDGNAVMGTGMTSREIDRIKHREIKQNLQRIQDTETKIGDMVSRHIQRRGTDSFENSNFVITSRSNAQLR